MRINKFLAESNIASRRACDNLIKEGKVLVNGKPCQLGQDVNESDVIKVDGKVVSLSRNYEYYIMNKPKGYICSVSDDKGRKTVMDLLPKTSQRIVPVGRLDYDTEGLLILTNDGDLTFRLTHPKNEIPKTYSVRIEGGISSLELGKLRGGVYIDGYKTRKCSVNVVDETKNETKLTVTISEGKNRQVRKMFEAIGKNVVFLKRVKIGELKLTGLDRGACRKLNKSEIDYLKNL